MLTPMPSPKGTNRERLYWPDRRRGAAYDAARTAADDADEPRRFLEAKLSRDDLKAFDELTAAKTAKDAELAGTEGGTKADGATESKTDKSPVAGTTAARA